VSSLRRLENAGGIQISASCREILPVAVSFCLDALLSSTAFFSRRVPVDPSEFVEAAAREGLQVELHASLYRFLADLPMALVATYPSFILSTAMLVLLESMPILDQTNGQSHGLVQSQGGFLLIANQMKVPWSKLKPKALRCI